MHCFCDWVIATCPQLHILINNAAQTIRRPCAYYRGLVEQEMKPLTAPQLIAPFTNTQHQQRADAIIAVPSTIPGMNMIANFTDRVSWIISAQLSLVPVTGDDVTADEALFPLHAMDTNMQPVDLRPTTTWRLKAAEVSTVEVAEVMMINTIAPFTITARLQSLLEKSSPRSFVVQCSN